MSRNHNQYLTPDLRFQMIYVPAGSFRMGSPHDDPDADDDEKSDDNFIVSVPAFWLAEYPVTQALWKAVMQGHELEDPAFFKGDDRPVETVSWDDAQLFIQKLNDLTAETREKGTKYRLPTEAQWEFAARGGPQKESHKYKYAGSDKLNEVGWFNANSHGETKPVGLRMPNILGLHEMSGNVREWCEDDWHDNYKGAPTDGRAWIDEPRGSGRVLRGGGWDLNPRYCRVARRGSSWPVLRVSGNGFRLALALQ